MLNSIILYYRHIPETEVKYISLQFTPIAPANRKGSGGKSASPLVQGPTVGQFATLPGVSFQSSSNAWVNSIYFL